MVVIVPAPIAVVVPPIVVIVLASTAIVIVFAPIVMMPLPVAVAPVFAAIPVAVMMLAAGDAVLGLEELVEVSAGTTHGISPPEIYPMV